MSTIWIDRYLKDFGTAINDIRSLSYLADQLEAAIDETEKWILDCGADIAREEQQELDAELSKYTSALSDVRHKLLAV